MTEKWVPLYGWEGYYQVSDQGRVRSNIRYGETQFGIRRYGGKVLKPVYSANRYPKVNLTKPGKRYQIHLHTAVLESFVGPAPKGMEACHNNGNRHDARLHNLRWDTRKNNHADKKRHGTWQGGDNHWMRKSPEKIKPRPRDSLGRFA